MSAPSSDPREQSVGDLLRQLSEQTSTLVRQELALAKAELTQKGAKAGHAGGLLGGAATCALLAAGALTAALIALLDTAMATWLAALLVAVVLGAVAALLGLRGRDELKEAAPAAPEQTIETLKEDIQWAKTHKQSGATSKTHVSA